MTAKHATINTVTLTCSNCGSGHFTKLDQNEYRCTHCQAVTLVEDNVAERLEQILRGMQAPATPRVKPNLVITAAAIAVAVISIPVVISLMNGSSRTSYQAAPRVPPIDASLVKLTDTREIANGSRKQLLLMMRNETGKPINAPSVSAQFYQGDLAQNSASGSPLSRTLLPGEYSPVLIDLPSQPYSRYELRIGSVSPAMSAITRQVAASKVQLVQNDGAHRLVGILKNEGASAISGAQVTVMLYDAGGKLIGSGNGYGAAGSLAAGAATTFDVRCELYGEGAVASYEYMVQTTASGGQDASTQANAASRMQRISPAAIRAIPKPRLTALELLDENFALFDPAQLKLSAPRRLLDEIDRPRLYAEVSNTSDRYVALSPRASIAVFDGSQPLELRQSWELPAYLYPGERVPVELVGRDFARYTEVKTDWTPAKRAKLPGPRPKLAVTVENTEAAVGTGTLNFSYRFRYKYVVVHGRVRNDDPAAVKKVKVWISLYDAQDQLTGARSEELRLPRLAPGDSAPFQLDVKQYGANFKRVAVVYDAVPE